MLPLEIGDVWVAAEATDGCFELVTKSADSDGKCPVTAEPLAMTRAARARWLVHQRACRSRSLDPSGCLQEPEGFKRASDPYAGPMAPTEVLRACYTVHQTAFWLAIWT